MKKNMKTIKNDNDSQRDVIYLNTFVKHLTGSMSSYMGECLGSILHWVGVFISSDASEICTVGKDSIFYRGNIIPFEFKDNVCYFKFEDNDINNWRIIQQEIFKSRYPEIPEMLKDNEYIKDKLNKRLNHKKREH